MALQKVDFMAHIAKLKTMNAGLTQSEISRRSAKAEGKGWACSTTGCGHHIADHRWTENQDCLIEGCACGGARG